MPIYPIEPEIIATHLLQSFASPTLDLFFSAATWLGNPAFWIMLAAFYFWKGDERKSFSIGAIILFASALVGIIKPLAGRLRPLAPDFRVIATDIEGRFSMPSGHATTVAGIYGYFWEKFTPTLKVLGIIIVAVVMVSRVYLGAHFLGDVVVGVLFGFVIGRILHFFEGHLPQLKLGQKKAIEEVGVISFVIFGVIVSALFRSIALAGLLLGFFAGMFAFKLLEFDSEKISGRKLAIKLLFGFAGVGLLALAGMKLGFEPEGYFLAGLWITFIYPLAYGVAFGTIHKPARLPNKETVIEKKKISKKKAKKKRKI